MARDTELQLEQVSAETGHEAERPPQPGEVESRIDAQTQEMRDFLVTIESDVKKIETDTSPEAAEFRAGLMQIQEEVKVLEQTLWERVAGVIKAPFQFVRSYFEARHETELQIPDNPKVIARLKKQVNSLERKFYDHQMKESRKKKEYSHLPEVLPDALFSRMLPLVAEYKRANKEDSTAWNEIGSFINKYVGNQIRALLTEAEGGYRDEEKFHAQAVENIDTCLEMRKLLVDPIPGYYSEQEYTKALGVISSALDHLHVKDTPEQVRLKEVDDVQWREQYRKDEAAMLVQYPDVHAWRLRSHYHSFVDVDTQWTMLNQILEGDDIFPLTFFEIGQLDRAHLDMFSQEARKKILDAYVTYEKFDDIGRNCRFFYDQLRELPREKTIAMFKKMLEASSDHTYLFLNIASVIRIDEEMRNEISVSLSHAQKQWRLKEKVVHSPLAGILNPELINPPVSEEKHLANLFIRRGYNMAHIEQAIERADDYGLNAEELKRKTFEMVTNYIGDPLSMKDSDRVFELVETVLESNVLDQEQKKVITDEYLKTSSDAGKFLSMNKECDKVLPSFQNSYISRRKKGIELLFEVDFATQSLHEREQKIYKRLFAGLDSTNLGSLFSSWYVTNEQKDSLFSAVCSEGNSSVLEAMYGLIYAGRSTEGTYFTSLRQDQKQQFAKVAFEHPAGETYGILLEEEGYLCSQYEKEQIIAFLEDAVTKGSPGMLLDLLLRKGGAAIQGLLFEHPDLSKKIKGHFIERPGGKHHVHAIREGRGIFSQEEMHKMIDSIVEEKNPDDQFDLIWELKNISADEETYRKVVRSIVDRGPSNRVLHALKKVDQQNYFLQQSESLRDYMTDQDISDFCARVTEAGSDVELLALYQDLSSLPHSEGIENTIRKNIVQNASVQTASQLLTRTWHGEIFSDFTEEQQMTLAHKAISGSVRDNFTILDQIPASRPEGLVHHIAEIIVRSGFEHIKQDGYHLDRYHPNLLLHAAKKYPELVQRELKIFLDTHIADIDYYLEMYTLFAKGGVTHPDSSQYIFDLYATYAQQEETDELKNIKNRLRYAMIIGLSSYDPSIKSTLENPEKLGGLRDIVINRLLDYIHSIHETDFSKIRDIVQGKLREVKRVFESSDSSEVDRRGLFLDKFSYQQGLLELARRDLEEIVNRSGSSRQIQYLERRIESASVTDDEKQKDREVLQETRDRFTAADVRNRQLYTEKQKNGSTVYLPEGSLTHGAPVAVFEQIVDSGNLTGELLGPRSKSDFSGALGVDFSRVQQRPGEEKTVDQKTFSERYEALCNRSYGDVVFVYSQYEENLVSSISEDEKKAERVLHAGPRLPVFSGVIGYDHHLVRSGIATTEITSVIVREETAIATVKKGIAKKGMYIPIVSTDGTDVFTPEEFDEMRVFYHTLADQGYPDQVIDSVYAFYKQPVGGEKHEVVIQKAFQHVKEGNKSAVDLAVLVDFLRTNDLNERDLSWYAAQSFDTLYAFIQKTVGRKKRTKARETFFDLPESGVSVKMGEKPSQVNRKKNAFIDAYLERQIPFVYGEDLEPDNQKVLAEERMTNLIFKEISPKKITEIAREFSEFKKEFMRSLWEKTWVNILSDSGIGIDKKQLDTFKKMIVPAVVGSVGRGEVVLGSDLDYLLYVDDVSSTISAEDQAILTSFVNNVLSPRMDTLLEEQGIHADAGLAKSDRQPFTRLSVVKNFSIDLMQSRQQEEPTTIIDSEALFDEQKGVVQKAMDLLVNENTSAHLLTAYIEKDLESGTRFPGYQANFEQLYASVASGQLMNRIKESLQRTVVFKIYHLLFSAFDRGDIPKEIAASIPASTEGKIALLKERGVLTEREAVVCSELLAVAYKLRFLGEIYSEEAKQTDKKVADKVKNVRFRLEDISFQERLRLVRLLKDFKTSILYK